MDFFVLSRGEFLPSEGRSCVFLKIDHWNDFSFVTMFDMSLYDDNGVFHDIGRVKIGFRGQTTSVSTYSKMLKRFDSLDESFFSLGQGVEFYSAMSGLEKNFCDKVLSSLRDIVLFPEIIDAITDEDVFGTSLLRSTSLSVVKGKLARVLARKAELTDYSFKFVRPETDEFGRVEMSFKVSVNAKPNMNIHAVIGRNGVGKTTLLNGMIDTVVSKNLSAGFLDLNGVERPVASDYFSSLVSVSFSAFDPFKPPREQPEPAKGTCYFYIGLKDSENEERLRTIPELRRECIAALVSCFSSLPKTSRWLSAIEKLGSDENFSCMRLEQLESVYRALRSTCSAEQSDTDEFKRLYLEKALPYLSKMSSGHAVVLLTITRLVAAVEEKTLVLLDEPESHLHPPLLSAFIRALADLLHDQNGVAIIATHSPVVLQEIPRSCAWIVHRVGKDVITSRPKIETFSENVGLLTSEVFNLEVERSGFHGLLARSVIGGGTYESILSEYNNQLGFEGKAILRALIYERDKGLQS